MGFFLFLLVNAILFIRPAEIIPDLQGLPLYNIAILTCLAFSAPDVLKQLNGSRLTQDPITFFVLGLQAAVVLSHLAHLDLFLARTDGIEFFKVVLYYLLLISLVNSLARLRMFLMALIGYTAIMAGLTLLNFHGAIQVPSLDPLMRHDINEATGEIVFYPQLRGSGIFNDPNDLCFFLAMATVLTLYFWTDRRLPAFRLIGLGLFGLFGYAIALTRSRGGFLALIAGVLVFLVSRFGGRRAIALAGLVLPVLFVLFAGRQTTISTSEGTAQSRMQLWAEGLSLFQTAPLFGIGMNQYSEELGHVAHNSFVHAFTELGLFGGSLYLNIFVLALRWLYLLKNREAGIGEPELRRLRHYLLAALTAYVMGMMSLSRCYALPTYMMIGLADSYLCMPQVIGLLPDKRLTPRLFQLMALISTAFLIFIYVFIRVFVHW